MLWTRVVKRCTPALTWTCGPFSKALLWTKPTGMSSTIPLVICHPSSYPSQAQMAPVAQPAKIQSDPKCAPLGGLGGVSPYREPGVRALPGRGGRSSGHTARRLVRHPSQGVRGGAAGLSVATACRNAFGGIALDVADSVGLTPDTPRSRWRGRHPVRPAGDGRDFGGGSGSGGRVERACAAGYVSPRVLAWQGYVDRTSRCARLLRCGEQHRGGRLRPRLDD